MTRLLSAFLLLFTLSSAQDSWNRLAAAAKLWAFIKYTHPRALASDVDWDRAFTDNTSQCLAAGNDAQFVAALNGMLAGLHDPGTTAMEAVPGAHGPRFLTIRRPDGTTLVRVIQDGARHGGRGAGNGLDLTGAGPVVFDLRDVTEPPPMDAQAIPVSRPDAEVFLGARYHSGYAAPDNSGSGGYSSGWEAVPTPPVFFSPNPVTPVFLVNSRTTIPRLAIAIQASGAGAIVSEDPITSDQADLYQTIPVLGHVWARVRTEMLWWYKDGTTGLGANRVLNQTGDAALQSALDIARAGTWPTAPARTPAVLPPAMFPETTYAQTPYPSLPLRLLAAARIWGVFHFFHPYRYLYGEDWDKVLIDFLPRMAAASNALEYNLAVAAMVTHVHDSHCYLFSDTLNAYFGTGIPPVEMRWIENQPVVTRLLDNTLSGQVHPGDIVTSIDGQPVQDRIDALSPYLAASTPQSLYNKIMQSLLAGPGGSTVRAGFQTADGSVVEISLVRSTTQSAYYPFRSGPVFRLIDSKTGYVDLARLTNDQVDQMFSMFQNTTGFIMDMRGYPNGTAWSIAPRLTDEDQPVNAIFRRNVVAGAPDAQGNFITTYLFTQSLPYTTAPRYHGRTVMLIDDRAISQSEHSGLMYRTANGTSFIGSPTAGANGDVTYFYAPGGIGIYFSGHDVRWPDGSQLQRIGLVPDIAVAPTVAGIRAGRDEILERAVEYMEGP